MKLVLRSTSVDWTSNDTSFRELGIEDSIVEGLATIGIRNPTRLQVVVLPRLMENNDNLYLMTNSGAGKTMVVIIAMLNFVDTTKNHPQVLCLLPTIEMAQQTRFLASRFGAYKGVKVCLIGQTHNVGKYNYHFS